MLYLDTSAFLKLVVQEAHSTDLRVAVDAEELWSSMALDVEAHRAAQRLQVEPSALAEWLAVVNLVMPTESTFAMARTVGPSTLRTFDALHLAAALELGPDLAGLVTYDKRLAAGADSVGMAVLAPGLTSDWWAG